MFHREPVPMPRVPIDVDTFVAGANKWTYGVGSGGGYCISFVRSWRFLGEVGMRGVLAGMEVGEGWIGEGCFEGGRN